MEKLVELARTLLRDPPPHEAVQELFTLSMGEQWAVMRAVILHDRKVVNRDWVKTWIERPGVPQWGLHHVEASVRDGILTPEWAEVKRIQQELQAQL
jgi:hypothetical protein